MSAHNRTKAQRIADEIIALVRETSVGGRRGDTSGLVMMAAYVHGFRRFVAIRQLAGEEAGIEAMILARSLLSLVARAAYVDEPSDPAERERRFYQHQANDLREELRTIERLEEAGFDVEAEVARSCRQALAEIGDVGRLPNDTELMRDYLQSLRPFHARIYGPGSEHVHFGQRTALAALRGRLEFSLDAGDAELADEALWLAIMTYGLLLERSEKTVRHGLEDRVAKLAGAE